MSLSVPPGSMIISPEELQTLALRLVEEINQSTDKKIEDAKRECAEKTDEQFARVRVAHNKTIDALKVQNECVVTELKSLKADSDKHKNKQAHIKRNLIICSCAAATVFSAGLASPALIVEVAFEAEIQKIKDKFPELLYHERVRLFEKGSLTTNGKSYSWPKERSPCQVDDSDSYYHHSKRERYETVETFCAWDIS